MINKIILVEKKIYLSQKLRKKVFRQCHNVKIAEHQKNKDILKRMKRTYYFPKIRKYVENSVRKCDTC
jgi:hypothetical protein